MLRCGNVYAGYDGRDVVRGVSLEAGRGEMVCIIGPNGCGKSTFLKAAAAILPYRGSVTVDGAELSAMTRRRAAQKIALMSQMPEIYFPYTVYETVALARYARMSSPFKTPGASGKKVIRETLQNLELEHIENKTLDELSGGQLQRVFLARTIAQEPEIILLDEPTNHLDLKHQIEFLRLLADWARTRGAAVIGVLHDLNLALSFFSRALLMKDGGAAAAGETEMLLKSAALKDVYGIDIPEFMRRSLGRWTAG